MCINTGATQNRSSADYPSEKLDAGKVVPGAVFLRKKSTKAYAGCGYSCLLKPASAQERKQ